MHVILTKTVNTSLMCLLLLLTTTLYKLDAYACAQLSARFAYAENAGRSPQSYVANDDDDPAQNSETKLKLLEETQTNDPFPIEFYRKLNNISDISEFIEQFVDKDSMDPMLGLEDDLKRSVERSARVATQPATCAPDNTVVPLIPLEPADDPNIYYYPKCTRVKRCSGCCNTERMSCQPTETEQKNFLVHKMRNYNKRVGYEIVVLEEHLKCKCDCRIKAKDCNAYQRYDPNSCLCECINYEAKDKCTSQVEKTWDARSCRCVCLDNLSCTTGTIFDENQCRCIKQTETTVIDNVGAMDRKRLIVPAIPVETDDTTLYTV